MPTKRDPRAPCRPNDTPKLHEKLIRELIDSDPRMCRNGFWRQHAALLDRLKLDADDFPVRPFLPDAFMFNEEEQEILLYEVEVSCPLSPRKLHDYGWFWFCWDGEGGTDWLPRLFTIDRYGNRNELPMHNLYYENLAA